jgi:hypothetical protein
VRFFVRASDIEENPCIYFRKYIRKLGDPQLLVVDRRQVLRAQPTAKAFSRIKALLTKSPPSVAENHVLTPAVRCSAPMPHERCCADEALTLRVQRESIRSLQRRGRDYLKYLRVNMHNKDLLTGN